MSSFWPGPTEGQAVSKHSSKYVAMLRLTCADKPAAEGQCGGLPAAHCTVLGPSGREVREPSATAAARLAAPGVLHHQAVQEHSSCSPGHGRKQLHVQNSPKKTPCWDPSGLCLCLKSLPVCPRSQGQRMCAMLPSVL